MPPKMLEQMLRRPSGDAGGFFGACPEHVTILSGRRFVMNSYYITKNQLLTMKYQVLIMRKESSIPTLLVFLVDLL